MKKIYPLVTPIKKKYYDNFSNDIIKIKQKNLNIKDVKNELLRESIID